MSPANVWAASILSILCVLCRACTYVAKTLLSWVSPVYTGGSLWPQEPGFLCVHLATHIYASPTSSAFLTFPKAVITTSFCGQDLFAPGELLGQLVETNYSVTSIFCTLGVLQLEKLCSVCLKVRLWRLLEKRLNCMQICHLLPSWSQSSLFFSLWFLFSPSAPKPGLQGQAVVS